MAKQINEHIITEAAQRLSEAAPGADIILFGSYARGDYHEESDLDFLVVEPVMHSRHDEMVRLRDVLRPLHVSVDIVVTDTAVFDTWSNVPGTIYYEARQEGKVLHVAR